MNIDDVHEINGVEVDRFVPNGDLHIAYTRGDQLEYLRAAQRGPNLKAWAAWVPSCPFIEVAWINLGAPGETEAALDAMDRFETMIELN